MKKKNIFCVGNADGAQYTQYWITCVWCVELISVNFLYFSLSYTRDYRKRQSYVCQRHVFSIIFSILSHFSLFLAYQTLPPSTIMDDLSLN